MQFAAKERAVSVIPHVAVALATHHKRPTRVKTPAQVLERVGIAIAELAPASAFQRRADRVAGVHPQSALAVLPGLLLGTALVGRHLRTNKQALICQPEHFLAPGQDRQGVVTQIAPPAAVANLTDLR